MLTPFRPLNSASENELYVLCPVGNAVYGAPHLLERRNDIY